MSDRPMIEIKNIYKQFGSVRALNGVSLNIYPGKVMVIIGPSGSGKSTLLRCMNHMEVEDQGEVWVDGDHLKWQPGTFKSHSFRDGDGLSII